MAVGLDLAAMGFSPLWIVLIYILIIWSAIWKLIALWKCGRNNQLAWFVVIGILNTAGILPIIYLIWFQKKSRKK